ncbi:MAG TPA: hypothetical protein VHB18_08465 [Mycobacteriales bacterium]|nr:hypothetical protein [Mycobacteriales bacterium]
MTDRSSPQRDPDIGELATALRLLSDGVPLTLLLDLAGPLHSRDLYREEVGDTGWLVGVA